MVINYQKNLTNNVNSLMYDADVSLDITLNNFHAVLLYPIHLPTI